MKDLINKANYLLKYKNFRKSTKFFKGHKFDFYNYVIPDYELFKKEDAFFMRGFCVIDDKDVSLGLRKFYNHNENPDSIIDNDLTDYIITIKHDGTLIIPYMLDGEIHLRTKNTVEGAYVDLANSVFTDDLKEMVKKYFDLGMTLCLELVSPKNKIVVDYNTTELKPICLIKGDNVYPYEILKPFNEIKTLDELIKEIEIDNFEGIVAYKDGKAIKLKTKKYLELHKVNTGLNLKSIFNLILDEKIDDLKPKMTKEVLDIVKKIEIKISDKLAIDINDFFNYNIYNNKKDLVLNSKNKVSKITFSVLMKNFNKEIDIDLIYKDFFNMYKNIKTENDIRDFLDFRDSFNFISLRD